jgi:tetratricopeptide repeat protein 30|tara:strand:- start:482 stop:670 length:189 start_codon:yes stop_codon:yes gene_type:complete
MVQTSPEEAYRKFDDLTNKHIEGMRKLTKHIQDSRMSRDNEQIKGRLFACFWCCQRKKTVHF